LLSATTAGCGRADLDVLLPTNIDPCSEFTSATECTGHGELNCSFQPNTEGCRMSDPNCAAGICRSSDGFLRRADRNFVLNGSPFRFVGVSSWAMLQPEGCGSATNKRETWVESIYDDLVPARVKVARVLAPQSTAGASGRDYTLLDAAVRGARRAGIRIQFVLGVHDGECNTGGKHDAAWYQSGYQQKERNYALSYQDYALNVVSTYAKEPTVLGYALMHNFAGSESIDPAALSSFASHMGQLVHDRAPNQLVSLDYAWHGGAADELATYHALETLQVADFIDVDDYTFNYPPAPLDPALVTELEQIDKPAVIGEGAFGLLGTDDAALKARADAARGRSAEWRAANFSGALFWAYDPGWKEQSEEFDARPADPMLQPGGVVASAPW
jgi:hypothetical protein